MADSRDTTIPRRTRRRPPARAAARQHLAQRAALEALIQRAIEALDALDGDPDLEDGDMDSCPAHDDDPQYRAAASSCSIGREEDAEPDDEDVGAAEDEPHFPLLPRHPGRPYWGSINRPCADALAKRQRGAVPILWGRRV